MSVRFVDRRPRGAHAPLTRIEQQQLDAIGPLYFGGKGRVQIVDDDFEDDPMESRSLMTVDTWRGVDGDRHVYDAWFYMGDSGSIFRAGTTEVVGEIIQCGLECSDPAARAMIGPALVEAKLLPKSDLSYKEFAALLAAQDGAPATPTRAAPKKPKRAAPKPKAKRAAAKKPPAKQQPAAKKSPKKRAKPKKPARVR